MYDLSVRPLGAYVLLTLIILTSPPPLPPLPPLLLTLEEEEEGIDIRGIAFLNACVDVKYYQSLSK